MHDSSPSSWLRLPLDAARLTFAMQTRVLVRMMNLASGAPALPTDESQRSRAPANQAKPRPRSATSSAASPQPRRTRSESARKKSAKENRKGAKSATKKA